MQHAYYLYLFYFYFYVFYYVYFFYFFYVYFFYYFYFFYFYFEDKEALFGRLHQHCHSSHDADLQWDHYCLLLAPY